MKRQVRPEYNLLERHLTIEMIDHDPIQSEHSKKYPVWYQVTSRNDTVILYLAKGHEWGPKEVVPFYVNGRMHASFSTSLRGALNLGIKDAIIYFNSSSKQQ